MARGAIMCLFDGVLLGLLCSASHALGASMLGLKTPFANVAGSSALLAGKLGPAHGRILRIWHSGLNIPAQWLSAAFWSLHNLPPDCTSRAGCHGNPDSLYTLAMHKGRLPRRQLAFALYSRFYSSPELAAA